MDEMGWAKKIVKLFRGMKYMEKHKFLEPHFSKSCGHMAHFVAD